MRRTLALTLFVALIAAANAFALGEARIQGKVIDSVTKKPIVGATIKIQATSGHTVKQEYKTDKNGEYRFLVLDATLNYDFTWSADGYQSFQTNLKLKLGDLNTRDVELTPASAVAKTTAAAPDPAVVAYNEGAALANDGKVPEAIAKMEEAASKKADFSAAYQALAHLYFRHKEYAKSVEYANKAIGVTGDDQDMFAVLADDYTALNQKDKAAEYRKKLPADANALFNEAASLINAGKDNQAEPLLRQAITANDKMAVAYYELRSEERR